MDQILEGPVCGPDGCSVEGQPPATPRQTNPARRRLKLEIFSDAICPWCWVAKKRLAKTLDLLKDRLDADITWHAFELNPEMPKAGLDRKSYRSRKFGSWERSQLLDAQVTAVAAGDGLAFRHEIIARTPNTFDAHRLVWLAGIHGRQDETVETLFKAYFNEGRDVGDPTVLADVAQAVGLDRSETEQMLAGDRGVAEVRADLDRASELRLMGVPAVFADGVQVLSGAVRPELMAENLLQAAGLD